MHTRFFGVYDTHISDINLNIPNEDCRQRSYDRNTGAAFPVPAEKQGFYFYSPAYSSSSRNPIIPASRRITVIQGGVCRNSGTVTAGNG